MQPQDLIRGSIKLYSLPEIVIKINDMVENPSSTASDIGKLISQDPALSARLLKIANSPLYGFPSRVDTVSRAITIIGTRGLRDLTLAASAIQVFGKISGNVINMQDFWRHSLYCAVTARLLATKCNALRTEPFFVSGLLHDIGQLVMLNKIPEMARETHYRAKDTKVPLQVIEKEVMGFDHAQVGGELLRLWRLPVNIQDAVEFHHNPDKAIESPLGAAIVHIANSVANTEGRHTGAPGEENDIDSMAWAITGLKTEDIDAIRDEIRLQFDATIGLFTSKAA